MGKLLRLKDGTAYTATIDSTITGVTIPVEKYADVDAMKKKFTTANLSAVEFDGRTYTDLELIGEEAGKHSNQIMAHFSFNLGIEDRIAQERQDAVDAYTLQLIEEGLL